MANCCAAFAITAPTEFGPGAERRGKSRAVTDTAERPRDVTRRRLVVCSAGPLLRMTFANGRQRHWPVCGVVFLSSVSDYQEVVVMECSLLFGSSDCELFNYFYCGAQAVTPA